MKKVIRTVINKMGYDLTPISNQTPLANDNVIKPESEMPVDASAFEQSIIQRVKAYTMTSPERILSLIRSVDYVLENDIKGSVVECGVWKGGSMMAVALTLLERQRCERDLYLFDTFEGMPSASEVDISIGGDNASQLLELSERSEDDHLWAYSPLEKVKLAVHSTGYPRERISFVKGMVEETILKNAPPEISILRLDTDWYESTKHELFHLFPRLAVGGILIIDDYGHWQGAKKAVDEYIKANKVRILLQRIDYTGRIAVKQCR